MSVTHGIGRRDVLKRAALAAAVTELVPCGSARAQPAPRSTVGRGVLLKGLDGMSRVADPGSDPFTHGHMAAAVMSSSFFCRQEKLDEATQKELLALVEGRLLTAPIYAPRAEERADPALIERLVKDLESGIGVLRAAGHNIIFATLSLKALREAPEAVTPARIGGLCAMVRSFGTGGGRGAGPNPEGLADLSDEPRFVRFVFREYLSAVELYVSGKGHHGFAGHLLTIGHALLELRRMGCPELAAKGLPAYWQFVRQARAGADLGGRRVADAPAGSPGPLSREYWASQRGRRTGEIVSSHLIKYPYSFFALARELRDEELKARILGSLYHLTAIT